MTSINLLIWALDECGALDRISSQNASFRQHGIEEVRLVNDGLDYENVQNINLASQTLLEDVFRKEYARLLNIAKKLGYSEDKFETTLLRNGGNMIAIKVNHQSSYRIRALYEHIEVTVDALEKVDNILQQEIYPKLVNDIIQKTGNILKEDATNRMSRLLKRREKTFRLFRIKGTSNSRLLYLVDSITEEEYKDFVARQDKNVTVVNLIHEEWENNHPNDWHNIRLNGNLSNYRKSVTQIVRAVRDLKQSPAAKKQRHLVNE